LMTHFKTVKRISEATFEDLEIVVGASRAQKIINFYNPK